MSWALEAVVELVLVSHFVAQGLALTPDDAWSVHSVAHVYEMKAEVDNGLKFMESREKDWQVLLLIIA